MRLVIRIDESGHLRWTMVCSRERPEPVAQGVRSYPDVDGCYRAASELERVPMGCAKAVQEADGRWRWSLAGFDGRPFAQSPTTFPTAAASGYALYDVRRALATSVRP
jgi:hypothetical protein